VASTTELESVRRATGAVRHAMQFLPKKKPPVGNPWTYKVSLSIPIRSPLRESDNDSEKQ
jgi:hypothetical protein